MNRPMNMNNYPKGASSGSLDRLKIFLDHPLKLGMGEAKHFNCRTEIDLSFQRVINYPSPPCPGFSMLLQRGRGQVSVVQNCEIDYSIF